MRPKPGRKSELIFHTHVLYVHSPDDGKTLNMWCSSRATHLFHRRSQYLGVRPTFGELHVWRAPKFSSYARILSSVSSQVFT